MKSKILLALLAVVVLVGGFIVLKPKQTAAPSQTILQQSQPKTFELVVKNRQLISGGNTLKVRQGDQVVIRITADEDEELHLHGYDKMVDLQKGVPAELKFTANLTGNFPYELEHSKTDIGSLQVQPQ